MEHAEQIWLLAERLTRVETSLGYEMRLVQTQLDLHQRRLDQLTLPQTHSTPIMPNISLFPAVDLMTVGKVLLAIIFPLVVLLLTGDIGKAISAMKGPAG